jgi:hypothetical protein
MTTGPDTTPGPQPWGAQPPGTQPPGGQPWPAPGAPGWAPGPPLPERPAPRARPRALRAALAIGAAVVVGVLRFTGVWGGADAPAVGDCVHTSGSSGTSFDVVSCTSKDAQYKVVGVDPTTMTSKDFQADDDLCTAVPETTVVLWSGQDTEKGTVYCAAPVGAAG